MSLNNLRSIFADNETISLGLKKFTLRLITPATEKIGWQYPKDENFLSGQLRSLLITTAGGAGHQRQAAPPKSCFSKRQSDTDTEQSMKQGVSSRITCPAIVT